MEMRGKAKDEEGREEQEETQQSEEKEAGKRTEGRIRKKKVVREWDEKWRRWEGGK